MGRLIRLIILMVVLIILASGGIAVYTVFMKPSLKSTVPEFRNKSVVEAVAEAEKLGLVVQVEPVASTLPEGRVLAQSPSTGTQLRQKQVVVLQVSRGGELHAVPDLRGQSLARAQAVIKEQGFTLGDVIRIREPNVQAGNVIAQSPSSPANIAAGRKIDLLVQEGSSSDGNVTVPDVNRMTESEARNILEASGVRVQAVDRVYSPLVPEGLAIETRPSAGSSIRSGQGVILKIATQRRPAGYMDDNSNASVRRVTSQTTTQTSSTTTTPANNTQTQEQRNVSVNVQGQGNVTVNENSTTTPAQSTTTPAITTPAQSGGNKTARIRYQVPPLASPMNLRVELTDPAGKRDILNRQVRGGESISAQGSYSQECIITVYLGGQSVWQERQR